MIKTTEVLTALETLLTEKTGYKVYIDTLAEGYEKPSFFIFVLEEKTEDVNVSTVMRSKKIKVVCDIEEENALSVTEIREKVCKIFENRKISVADKKLNILANVETNEDTNEIYVLLEMEFFDER